MGYITGPEKTIPLVQLEPKLYNYYKSLSKAEQKRLPSRTDPRLVIEI